MEDRGLLLYIGGVTLACSLVMGTLLMAASPEVPTSIDKFKIAIPDARGRSSTNKAGIVKRLREVMGAEVQVIGEKEFAKAMAKAGVSRRARGSRRALAAIGRKLDAHYVLALEVFRKGWLYTARAVLVDTRDASVQMRFESGYYKPRGEASDRGERIARTTVKKLGVLLSEWGKGPKTSTATVTQNVVEPPENVFDEATKAREEEMFGAFEEESIESSEDSRDADIFGGGFQGPGDAENADARLDEIEKRVAFGGRLFLRMNAGFLEGLEAEDVRVFSPNLLDAYVDARLTDRLRGYAQARLQYDFVQPDNSPDAFGRVVNKTQFFVDQLWLKLDILQTIYITMGKQRVKWGVSRFWNPTDFLNADFLDPLAIFDQRLGVSMARFHLPIESLNWNFYGILLLEDSGVLGRIGGAGRAEIVLGPTELSFSVSGRNDSPLRLGADISAGLWVFDLRAEAAVTYNSQTIFYRGPFEPDNGVLPNGFMREDEWIPQVVVGGEVGIAYGDDDAFYMGLEYFYNGAGYPNSDLYDWLVFRDTFAAQNCAAGPLDCPPRSFNPLYVGEHYGGAYLFFPNPGPLEDQTFQVLSIFNISDLSAIIRFDYTVQLFRYLSFNLFAAVHVGNKDGEFRLRLNFPEIPGVPQLAGGLTLDPSLVDVGLALNIAF